MKLEKLVKIVFVAYYVFLLIISVIPSAGDFDKQKVGILDFELRLDYFLHFCAYFGFFVLLLLQDMLKKTKPSFAFWSVFIATALLASGTEIIQFFLPYRSYNPLDMLSNLSGIVFGAFIYWIYQLRFTKITQKAKK